MNLLADARAALYDVLAPVLPGRVSSTPPASSPFPAPYIWIDQPDLFLGTAGTATRVTTATFPIWVTYDGAARAQVAGLDDVVAQVWDAVQQVRRATPQSASPNTVDVGGATVRAVVVSVDVTLAALTLCPPTPASIPPQPVPV